MGEDPPLPFAQLDFLYTPSADPAADARHAVDVLGGRLVFAIEAYGTRVAMVQLTEAPPALVFAGHLSGERPIHVFRVADLEASVAALRARGWDDGHRFGIPHGPGCAYRTPGGHRVAIYELTRPGAAEHLVGRRDF
jgi:hypothetical protein